MIDQALPDLESWVTALSQVELPVLKRTMTALDKMRPNAVNISSHKLSAVILQDPLMTLRVLAYLEQNRRKSQKTDITTIGRALIMIGVDPFFKTFSNLPLVEDLLKPQPQALLGLLKVISRAQKATRWAREWAIQRRDLNIEEIMAATLLHEVTEMLMWCFAPALALKMRDRLAENHKRLSHNTQEEIFGLRLENLKQALVRAWRMPQLLAELMDHANAEQPRVLNVTLAIDLARHSASNWEDPALPDDLEAIENLLRISHKAMLERLELNAQHKPLKAGRIRAAIPDASSRARTIK